jgi:hypothetical protein
MIGSWAAKLAAVTTASFCAFTAAFALLMQSMDSQVNLVLDTRGFLAHLYVPRLVLVVDPDFVQATPFEILVAASAGVATITPPATMSATENDVILRNMEEPLVVMLLILATKC